MALIMPVITVQMVIDLNRNVKVRLMSDNPLKYSYNQDSNDVLWEGMLYDIPDEYRTLETEYVGWLFKANCHYIIVWG